MNSFRKTILEQIRRIDAGRVFTFKDLTYDTKRTANVAVLLSEQCQRGELVRVDKGAYYRPIKSRLGLKALPLSQEEQFRYLTNKLSGYISGPYTYNKIGLTEQVSTTITIATPYPVRRFQFRNLEVVCQKSYCSDCLDNRLIPYLQLLDAIKDMKHIPGTSEQDIYDRVKRLYVSTYSPRELKIIVSLAKHYPPRVRRILSDLLGDCGQSSLQTELTNTLLPTTRYNLNYKIKKIFDYPLEDL